MAKRDRETRDGGFTYLEVWDADMRKSRFKLDADSHIVDNTGETDN